MRLRTRQVSDPLTSCGSRRLLGLRVLLGGHFAYCGWGRRNAGEGAPHCGCRVGDPGSGQKPVPTATRVSRPHVFLAAQVIALIAMLLA